ncbi:MAG: hypothetical protein RLY18_563 [Pseudomonadota bacterium]
MLDKLFPRSDHFSIKTIDHQNRLAIVEDKELGLEIPLSWGSKELKSAQIVGQYEVCFLYEDGSERIVQILT